LEAVSDYDDQRQEAERRISARDPDDWPTIALALTLALPVRSQDKEDLTTYGLDVLTTGELLDAPAGVLRTLSLSHNDDGLCDGLTWQRKSRYLRGFSCHVASGISPRARGSATLAISKGSAAAWRPGAPDGSGASC
jgi:hypothetical protein